MNTILQDRTVTVIITYFLVIGLYGFTEIALQLRFTGRKFKGYREKGLVFIMVPFYLSVYLPPVENLLVRNKVSAVFLIAGTFLLLLGIILRMTALLKLRENFSVAVESDVEGTLTRDGIYRYIRHPLYLAVLIISASGCIIFSCMVTWIFFLLTGLAILIRIKAEEASLMKRFPEYEEYMKGTRRLLPFIY